MNNVVNKNVSDKIPKSLIPVNLNLAIIKKALSMTGPVDL